MMPEESCSIRGTNYSPYIGCPSAFCNTCTASIIFTNLGFGQQVICATAVTLSRGSWLDFECRVQGMGFCVCACTKLVKCGCKSSKGQCYARKLTGNVLNFVAVIVQE